MICVVPPALVVSDVSEVRLPTGPLKIVVPVELATRSNGPLMAPVQVMAPLPVVTVRSDPSVVVEPKKTGLFVVVSVARTA